MRKSLVLIAFTAITACAPSPGEMSTKALTLSTENLAQRQSQARRFETKQLLQVQQAGLGVLQDLGFTIKETSIKSGVITGEKDRDAMETGQVASQVFFALVIASMGGRANPTWDQTQKIRVSLITQPSADGAASQVRVTFQRVVWDNHANVSKIETIDDPKVYQQFFDKLSQSLFLEAQRI
jgi:hypothetical protein